MKRTVVVIASALLFAATGCATMFNKESQHITFNSTPDSAVIEVNGLVLGKTPWTGPVKRSSEQAVVFKKEGYEPQTVQLKGEISGWVVANVLWGLTGLLSTSVDVGTGTGYSYEPGAYHVTLVSKGGTTSSVRDTVSDGQLKRFVLMFYPDIVREAGEGHGEKLDALMELTGHNDLPSFARNCRLAIVETAGPDAFAERVISTRRNRLSASFRPNAADVTAGRR